MFNTSVNLFAFETPNGTMSLPNKVNTLTTELLDEEGTEILPKSKSEMGRDALSIGPKRLVNTPIRRSLIKSKLSTLPEINPSQRGRGQFNNSGHLLNSVINGLSTIEEDESYDADESFNDEESAMSSTNSDDGRSLWKSPDKKKAGCSDPMSSHGRKSNKKHKNHSCSQSRGHFKDALQMLKSTRAMSTIGEEDADESDCPNNAGNHGTLPPSSTRRYGRCRLDSPKRKHAKPTSRVGTVGSDQVKSQQKPPIPPKPIGLLRASNIRSDATANSDSARENDPDSILNTYHPTQPLKKEEHILTSCENKDSFFEEAQVVTGQTDKTTTGKTGASTTALIEMTAVSGTSTQKPVSAEGTPQVNLGARHISLNDIPVDTQPPSIQASSAEDDGLLRAEERMQIDFRSMSPSIPVCSSIKKDSHKGTAPSTNGSNSCQSNTSSQLGGSPFSQNNAQQLSHDMLRLGPQGSINSFKKDGSAKDDGPAKDDLSSGKPSVPTRPFAGELGPQTKQPSGFELSELSSTFKDIILPPILSLSPSTDKILPEIGSKVTRGSTQSIPGSSEIETQMASASKSLTTAIGTVVNSFNGDETPSSGNSDKLPNQLQKTSIGFGSSKLTPTPPPGPTEDEMFRDQWEKYCWLRANFYRSMVSSQMQPVIEEKARNEEIHLGSGNAGSVNKGATSLQNRPTTGNDLEVLRDQVCAYLARRLRIETGPKVNAVSNPDAHLLKEVTHVTIPSLDVPNLNAETRNSSLTDTEDVDVTTNVSSNSNGSNTTISGDTANKVNVVENTLTEKSCFQSMPTDGGNMQASKEHVEPSEPGIAKSQINVESSEEPQVRMRAIPGRSDDFTNKRMGVCIPSSDGSQLVTEASPSDPKKPTNTPCCRKCSRERWDQNGTFGSIKRAPTVTPVDIKKVQKQMVKYFLSWNHPIRTVFGPKKPTPPARRVLRNPAKYPQGRPQMTELLKSEIRLDSYRTKKRKFHSKVRSSCGMELLIEEPETHDSMEINNFDAEKMIDAHDAMDWNAVSDPPIEDTPSVNNIVDQESRPKSFEVTPVPALIATVSSTATELEQEVVNTMDQNSVQVSPAKDEEIESARRRMEMFLTGKIQTSLLAREENQISPAEHQDLVETSKRMAVHLLNEYEGIVDSNRDSMDSTPVKNQWSDSELDNSTSSVDSDGTQISPAKDDEIEAARRRMEAFLAGKVQASLLSKEGNQISSEKEQELVETSKRMAAFLLCQYEGSTPEPPVSDSESIGDDSTCSTETSTVEPPTSVESHITPANEQELAEAQKRMDAFLAKKQQSQSQSQSKSFDVTPALADTPADHASDKFTTAPASKTEMQISPAKADELAEAQKRMEAFLEKKQHDYSKLKSFGVTSSQPTVATAADCNTETAAQRTEVSVAEEGETTTRVKDERASGNGMQISPAKPDELAEAQKRMDAFLANKHSTNAVPKKLTVSTTSDQCPDSHAKPTMLPSSISTDGSFQTESLTSSSETVVALSTGVEMQIRPANADELAEAQKRMDAYLAQKKTAQPNKRSFGVTSANPTATVAVENTVPMKPDTNSSIPLGDVPPQINLSNTILQVTPMDDVKVTPSPSVDKQISAANDKELAEAQKRMDAFLAKKQQAAPKLKSFGVTPAQPVSTLAVSDIVPLKSDPNIPFLLNNPSIKLQVCPIEEVHSTPPSGVGMRISPATSDELAEAQKRMDAFLANKHSTNAVSKKLTVSTTSHQSLAKPTMLPSSISTDESFQTESSTSSSETVVALSTGVKKQISPANADELAEAQKRMDAFLSKKQQAAPKLKSFGVTPAVPTATVPVKNTIPMKPDTNASIPLGDGPPQINLSSTILQATPMDEVKVTSPSVDKQISAANDEELAEAQKRMDAFLAKKQQAAPKLKSFGVTPAQPASILAVSNVVPLKLDSSVHPILENAPIKLQAGPGEVHSTPSSGVGMKISPATAEELAEAQKRMDAFLATKQQVAPKLKSFGVTPSQQESSLVMNKMVSSKLDTIVPILCNNIPIDSHVNPVEATKLETTTREMNADLQGKTEFSLDGQTEKAPSTTQAQDTLVSGTRSEISPAKADELAEAQKRMDAFLAKKQQTAPKLKSFGVAPAQPMTAPLADKMSGYNANAAIGVTPAVQQISPAKDDELEAARKRMEAFLAKKSLEKKVTTGMTVSSSLMVAAKIEQNIEVLKQKGEFTPTKPDGQVGSTKSPKLAANSCSHPFSPSSYKTPQKAEMSPPKMPFNHSKSICPNELLSALSMLQVEHDQDKEGSSSTTHQTSSGPNNLDGAQKGSKDTSNLKSSDVTPAQPMVAPATDKITSSGLHANAVFSGASTVQQISPAKDDELEAARKRMEAFLANKMRDKKVTTKTAMSSSLVVAAKIEQNIEACKQMAELTPMKKDEQIDSIKCADMATSSCKSPQKTDIVQPQAPFNHSKSICPNQLMFALSELPIEHNQDKEGLSSTIQGTSDGPLHMESCDSQHTVQRHLDKVHCTENLSPEKQSPMNIDIVEKAPEFSEAQKRISTPTKFHLSSTVKKFEVPPASIHAESDPAPVPVHTDTSCLPGSANWLRMEMAKLFGLPLPTQTLAPVGDQYLDSAPTTISLSQSVCPNELMTELDQLWHDNQQETLAAQNSCLTIKTTALLKSCMSNSDLLDKVPDYLSPLKTPCPTPTKMQFDKSIRPSRIEFSYKDVLRTRVIDLPFPKRAKKLVTFSEDSLVSHQPSFDEVVNGGGSGFRILSVEDHNSNTISFPKYVPPGN